MLASSKGSNWNMGHTMSGPTEQGWYSYTCQNWRSSSDNAQKVKPITHGNIIKFRAGYNFFATTSEKQSVSGSPAQLMQYVIELDSGVSLFATATVAAAALSVLNF